jgi:two-component system, sensor histidine kinase and response regulator
LSHWRGDVTRCEELGIAAYLTKPIKQSELFDMIAKVVGVDMKHQETATSEAAQIAGRLRPLRILLAEDSLVNQKLALGQLEPHGHQVVVVNNGKQAVETWASRPFDLILMDVQMPEMDGLTATQTIRKHERTSGGSHVPITAMTAHAMKGDRERCLAAGMDAYLSKPIRAKDLFATIEQLLAIPASTDHPIQIESLCDNVGREVTGQRSTSGTSTVPSEISIDVLDWGEALRNSGVGDEVLREMAVLFLDESKKLLTEISEAMSRGDLPGLRRAAHTLKGRAAALSAKLATESALELETIAKEARLDEAAPACANLERLRAALVAETQG